MLRQASEAGLEAGALVIRSRESEPLLVEWLRRTGALLLHVHAGIAWEGHHGV